MGERKPQTEALENEIHTLRSRIVELESTAHAQAKSDSAENMRTREIASLLRIAGILVSPGDFEHKSQHMLEELSEIMLADRAILRVRDNTKEILRPLIDNKQLAYYYQKNTGLSSSRNQGIQLAQGKYLVFLDSDDLLEPTKLEKQVIFMENNLELGLVHSSFIKFDNDGNYLGFRDTSFFSGRIYPKIFLHWSTLMATPCFCLPHEIG